MRTLSSAYLNAAKAPGRYPNLYAIIYGDETELTISGKDAIISMSIIRGDTAKPAYFEVGRAISSSAYLTVDRRRISREAEIISGAKIEIYSEFDRPDGTAIGSAILATMYISGYDTQDKDIGYISVVDELVYAGKDFNPDNLTYPIKLSSMMTEAFAQSGMSGVSMTLPCDPHVNSAPYKAAEPVADGMSGDPYICRDIIAKIAGMQMSDIFIDAEGNPDIYAYGDYITNTVTDDQILEMRVGSERYQVYQVIVKGYGERMAKDDGHFQRLPYSPRFEDMDNYHRGSDWWDDIVDRANVFVRKDWATATVTIAGVGELELGDFVLCGAEQVPIFISGIVYKWENAHFTETLYSFAYTLEEYYQAPANATVISTGTKEDTSGSAREIIFSPATPDLANNGDYWAVFSGSTISAGLANLTHFYKRVNGAWEERTFYLNGNVTAQPVLGDCQVMAGGTDGKSIAAVIEYVHFDYDSSTSTFDWEGTTYTQFMQFYPQDGNGVSHAAMTTQEGETIPSTVHKNGDLWNKLKSTTDNSIQAVLEYKNGDWKEQGTVKGGVGAVGNGLYVDNSDTLQLNLGSALSASSGTIQLVLGRGLKISNGELCIDFDSFEPVVNIANAIVVNKESSS